MYQHLQVILLEVQNPFHPKQLLSLKPLAVTLIPSVTNDIFNKFFKEYFLTYL
ncbi:hypothetical protein [Daejeonella lutea]|uniref:hypothetical protein n=1 Tax=Daejeonella lutea TaxID=572036 RepID=UPI001482C2CA|nr:hypothetical protein [Daejeonella lutea]